MELVEVADLPAITQFETTLADSTFKRTYSLVTLAQFCSRGEFQEGLDWFRSFLTTGGVRILTLTREELDARKTAGLGETEWTGGTGTIFVPEGFDERHPLNQLVNLAHKYKSLLLRRDGLRGERMAMADLFKVDLALLEVARFAGAPTGVVGTLTDEYARRLAKYQ